MVISHIGKNPWMGVGCMQIVAFCVMDFGVVDGDILGLMPTGYGGRAVYLALGS